VNVTTIRDGFKWTYFIKLKVKEDIPDNLRWRVFKIWLSLNPKYFAHLPWVNGKDPVSWNKKLWLSDIKFGIANSLQQAYYINWQSKNVEINMELASW
jgi:hypothetical protein